MFSENSNGKSFEAKIIKWDRTEINVLIHFDEKACVHWFAALLISAKYQGCYLGGNGIAKFLLPHSI